MSREVGISVGETSIETVLPLTPRQFGAVGGGADDGAALQEMLDNTPAGSTIDWGGETYITELSLATVRLTYDNQSANFVVEETITGGTSLATGKIVQIIDNGTTGTLYLSAVTAAFLDNETITGSSGGSAQANGTQAFMSGVQMIGKATIKAKNGTDFEYVLDVSFSEDTTIQSLTFDANMDGRDATTKRLIALGAVASTRLTLDSCTIRGSLGPVASPAVSSMGVHASGGCYGLRVTGCRFHDCGESATSRPSDGIFVRGDYCVISNCEAEDITDHAYVLEGCNYSAIDNCTVKNCTSFGGISNDTTADVFGNRLSNVTGTCTHVGSFGGAVGLYTFSTGKLVGAVVDNVHIKVSDSATGAGGALFCYGKLDRCKVSRVNIDPSASVGAMTAGIAVSGITQLNYDTMTVIFVAGRVLGGLTSGARATIDRVVGDALTTAGSLVLTSVSGTFQDNETIKEVIALFYKTETNPFTAGQTVTGGTSGATGTVQSVTDSGTTGTLYLYGASGTFANNELITEKRRFTRGRHG